jgi:predicted membrane protein (TIGR00267 family)
MISILKPQNERNPVEEAQKEHLNMRVYMRDVVLGSNDGLVSIFALVLGVVGGGMTLINIFLAGLAGTIAGAISMALGEYLSTKSQEEVFDSEMELEKLHIEHDFEREKEELYSIYRRKGFEGKLLDQIVEKISGNEEVMLDEMMINEFGVLEEERRSPYIAATLSGVSFTIGSLPAFLPFLFVSTISSGIILAGTLSCLALFLVGLLKGYITRFNAVKLGLENLVLGVIAGAITYYIGFLVGGAI